MGHTESGNWVEVIATSSVSAEGELQLGLAYLNGHFKAHVYGSGNNFHGLKTANKQSDILLVSLRILNTHHGA